MRYLFLHQNFPGQYKHAVRHLVHQPGNEVVFLTHKNENRIGGVRKIEYAPAREPAAQTHHYIRELERGVLNAQGVTRICLDLKREGFRPDIMIGHNGWGETLFLKDIWPEVPLLGYFEYFYGIRSRDLAFDKEFPPGFDDYPRVRIKNSINLLGLDAADWGQSPTRWQRGIYPAVYQPKISIIHEGIDTTEIQPDPGITVTLAGRGLAMSRTDEVITFVSRNLEPYRGFHVFMRALPRILKRRPKARVLIIGGDGVSYGRRLPPGETWRAKLMAEVGDTLDMDRVHFLGRIPYDQFLAILKLSQVHVYLTYPFVLSWSMLEAMASGCLIVGSATPPVEEVIRDRENGLLVDFFSIDQIVDRVDEVLDHPDRMQSIREQARRTIVERYDLHAVCLPQYLELIQTLATGRTPGEPVDVAQSMRRALELKATRQQDRRRR